MDYPLAGLKLTSSNKNTNFEVNIISLLPATTEIIYALGLGEYQVGRSHECDFPDSVQKLPVCSEPKYPFNGQSYEIDKQVKAILAEGLSIFRILTDKIKEMNPDFILTQDQCEVCAVNLDEVEWCLNQLGVHASILSFSPETLDDILSDIQTIADTLGVSNKGTELREIIKYQFEAVKRKTQARAPVHVEIIEWIDPLMSAGNWMPDLIELAGGYSTLGKSGKHSPFINFDILKKADPEIIIIIPCGYSTDQTNAEINSLLGIPGWNKLRAVKTKKMFIADGHQYFNRPGPRIADSVRILAEIINPQIFEATFKGKGWIRLSL